MIIFGKQVVLYALKHHAEQVETLFVAKELDKKIFSELKRAGRPIERLDFKKAQALAKNQNHQGMLAKINAVSFCENRLAFDENFAVMCVGITDAGNLGAIARTAWALGVGALIFSGVKSINIEALIRTSSGAALDLPLYLMPDTLQSVENFRQAGFQTFGGVLEKRTETSADGKDLGAIRAKKKLLLLGAEDTGLPKRIEERLDTRLNIAMAHQFDSLNVSAAAAILIDKIR